MVAATKKTTKRAKKMDVEKDAQDVETDQGYLSDEMTPAVIAELEDDAKELEKWKKKYKAASDEIRTRNDVLLEKMKRNDVTKYVCRNTPLIIEIEEGAEKLKVTKAKADIANPDDD